MIPLLLWLQVDEIASKFSPETILAELDKFTTSFMGKADEIASKFSPATRLEPPTY
ncbi:hypothetical protein [Bacillus amyloliquefaciens]|uniref:hypothetical protein n=1 Tax=Bacillus amyloliquefaciens TaxID=1390 RepID=UPI00293E8071|nr:hypothetical protein [Bacillus amyloliquefaciens]WOH97334.1 hypothetical protein R0744_19600 [Bacillus amyloliquefaciens]